jgi:hypothetical protein
VPKADIERRLRNCTTETTTELVKCHVCKRTGITNGCSTHYKAVFSTDTGSIVVTSVPPGRTCRAIRIHHSTSGAVLAVSASLPHPSVSVRASGQGHVRKPRGFYSSRCQSRLLDPHRVARRGGHAILPAFGRTQAGDANLLEWCDEAAVAHWVQELATRRRGSSHISACCAKVGVRKSITLPTPKLTSRFRNRGTPLN